MAAVAAAAVDSAAAAAATPGPFVLPGSYNVALVVDGKTVETKPLRVSGDPEVALTEAQRKQLYDMAIEMHELQKRTTEAAAGLAALNRQITQLSTDIAAKTDVPADVKTAFESLKTDATAMAPKLPVAAAGGGRGGGGGGGRGGADTSVVGKIGQAKNGMIGRHVAELDDDEGLHRREDRRAEGAVGRQRAVRPGGGGQHVAREVQPEAGSRRSRSTRERRRRRRRSSRRIGNRRSEPACSRLRCDRVASRALLPTASTSSSSQRPPSRYFSYHARIRFSKSTLSATLFGGRCAPLA